MASHSITDDLVDTLVYISDRIDDDRAGEASDAAIERTVYLSQEISSLFDELDGLRRAAMTLANHCAMPEALQVWTRTCSTLRTTFPTTLRSPSHLLVSAELDLLAIISYTGAARGTIRERRNHLVRLLTTYLEQVHACAQQQPPIDKENTTLAAAMRVVEDLADSPSLANHTAVWDRLNQHLEHVCIATKPYSSHETPEQDGSSCGVHDG